MKPWTARETSLLNWLQSWRKSVHSLKVPLCVLALGSPTHHHHSAGVFVVANLRNVVATGFP